MKICQDILGNIVIGRFGGNGGFKDFERRIHTAGCSCIDDGVCAADINEELGGDRRVDLAHAAVQQNGGQAAERSLVKLQQRLFACPRMFKVRQKRRKLAVSGAENADFFDTWFRLRCDFYPLYLRPPALSTALRAKISPPAKRPSTMFSRSSADERRRARGSRPAYPQRRPSNRSAIPRARKKQICALHMKTCWNYVLSKGRQHTVRTESLPFAAL